jgi:Zn-dependent protease with chaperone function
VNFFEHQAQARARSTRYLVLFFLATAAIATVVSLTVLGAFYIAAVDYGTTVPFGQWLRQHPKIYWWTAIGTVGAIGAASFYRIASLSSGGGAVAQSLGAILIDSSTRDPRLRQLLNVVEEVAIAAGVPVPQVYVLESEMGVNAFASGFNASDAAITVTQGALMHLTRDELQGVIGHEFSHVFNGDMRINTRLIGVLFGILFIGLIGRIILRSRVRGRGAGPLIVAGLVFLIIGYVGVFFGRMIQAAVSRSRESLADASAVQFTRNPLGLSGALKKIAVLSGALQEARSEEVSHMLFASRLVSPSAFFATHPPILDRIREIDPNFRPSDLNRISREPVAEPVVVTPATPPAPTGIPLTAAGLIAAVGQISEAALTAAANRRAAIPQKLVDAAREPSEALNVVLALILSADAAQRGRQLALIRADASLPADSASKIESYARDTAALDPSLRLPLFELSFPSMRRRDAKALRHGAELIDKLAFVDGNLSAFEYALSRLLRVQLYEVLAPRARRAPVVAPKLFSLRAEVQALFSGLAREGGGKSQAAYDQGVRKLFPMDTPSYLASVSWTVLDRALIRLDMVAPAVKQELIGALVSTVAYDRLMTNEESELLRAVCGSLHCPLPPSLTPASAPAPGG